MAEPALRIEGLSKKYRVVQGGERLSPYRTLRETLVAGAMAPFRRFSRKSSDESSKDFWALNDVSFEVQRGEVVGIIGRNGAGKSTLLKVLSRITKPTTGRVEINGRVGSLLEVGTGFHPELTGRENVFLNGSILGMSRREISRKFDEIVAFAEVERFLDTPVKRYSSGMYVRLAFAVAAHLEPEILIVDEVLAVGDAQFQKKCLGKMGEVGRSGRTVLFVSHNMAAVEQLTTRAILLDRGRVEFVGDTTDAILNYQQQASDSRRGCYDLRGRSVAELHRRVELIRAQLSHSETGLVEADEPLAIDVGLLAHEPVPPLRISFTIFRYDGTPVGSAFCASFDPPEPNTESTVRIEVDPHHLAPGRYQFSMAVGKGDNQNGGYEDYDRVYDILHFEVMNPVGDGDTVANWHPAWGPVRFPTPKVRVFSAVEH